MDVAHRIGVHESTLYNWERQRTVPEIRFMPKIIEFLGYSPTPSETAKTFQERLKALRTKLGLSQRKLAMKLGIDPGTLGSWERGRHRPTRRYRRTIEACLKRC
jgi:transcriptional regulator with XRE-family HTH domain